MKQYKYILLALALLALGVGILAAIQFSSSQTDNSAAVFSDKNGTPVSMQAGEFGGDFSLVQGDKTVKLSDFRGKVVLFYFGYTSCPDVCPTTLSILGAGLKELTPEEIAQVQAIFISVDPDRDHADKLMNYAKHFHPNFIGLTATDNEAIQKIAAQYGAFFAKADSDSALSYLIDHTSNSYVVSKDGKYVKILPHDTNKSAVASSIREAL